MSFSPIRLMLAIGATTLLAASVTTHARVLERAQDAIARLFPGAEFEQENILLTQDEQNAASALLGTPIDQRLVTLFRITTTEGQPLTAYLDGHRVRTLPETMMLSVDADGVIQSVDVLAFREPGEYMPRRAWYDQFNQRRFDQQLQLYRGIQGVTGATLTGRATVDATRKLLCLHKIIQQRKQDE